MIYLAWILLIPAGLFIVGSLIDLVTFEAQQQRVYALYLLISSILLAMFSILYIAGAK